LSLNAIDFVFCDSQQGIIEELESIYAGQNFRQLIDCTAHLDYKNFFRDKAGGRRCQRCGVFIK